MGCGNCHTLCFVRVRFFVWDMRDKLIGNESTIRAQPDSLTILIRSWEARIFVGLVIRPAAFKLFGGWRSLSFFSDIAGAGRRSTVMSMDWAWPDGCRTLCFGRVRFFECGTCVKLTRSRVPARVVYRSGVVAASAVRVVSIFPASYGAEVIG
jgi:hypothetical protein